MGKRVTLLPVIESGFTNTTEYLYPEPVEILAPRSFELNVEMAQPQQTGILGNTILGNKYFTGNTYNMNWVGPKQEIDKIRYYLTQLSYDKFLFNGLTDSPVVTPTILKNSRAMLASVLDSYKPQSSTYQPYLNYYGWDTPPTAESIGVRVGSASSTHEHQFATIPSYVRGYDAYFYMERGKDYYLVTDPYGYKVPETGEILGNHSLPVNFYILKIGGNDHSGSSVFHLTYIDTLSSFSFRSFKNYLPEEERDGDFIVKIAPATPNTSDPNNYYSNPHLRGVFVYRPYHIIKGAEPTEESAEKLISTSFDTIPSLLSPVDSGVYNILSPSLAEFSCTFMEVYNVL